MQEGLRISVSGIRGEVPDALNVEVASKFSSAFSSYLEEGRIGVCRDSRYSSHMLEMAVLSSVIASGLDCVDFGMLPIPFLQFFMREEAFTGGIAVTAGHNPLPWNAVVLLDGGGHYLEASEGSEVFNIYEAGDFNNVPWKELGGVEKKTFPIEHYFEEISKLVNVERISRAGFKVVADPCNGVVSSFLGAFGDFFNLELISINDDPEKPFPHPPEPSFENASQVEAVVKSTGADLGFLLNSDGSRISFVSEKGNGLSEECTFPLCLLSLKDRIKKAVSTIVTSGLADWVAERCGVKILRTKVGQSAVVHMMEAEGAGAGGEGSGSFALSSFSSGYDALLSLSLVLDLISGEEKGLSEIISPFPKLYMRKLKIEVPPERTYKVMDKLEDVYSKENPNFMDGIRIDRKGVWFNIRPSATEFLLRLFIEGEKEELVESIEEEIRGRIEL